MSMVLTVIGCDEAADSLRHTPAEGDSLSEPEGESEGEADGGTDGMEPTPDESHDSEVVEEPEEVSDGPNSQEEVLDPEPSTTSRFPADEEQDDREALIVTGLDGSSAETLVSPWLVVMRGFRNVAEHTPAGDAQLELTRYADDYPLSAYIDYFTPVLDQCVVRSGTAESEPASTNPPPLRIAGGSSVVLNTAHGPWQTLSLIVEENGVVYRLVDSVSGRMPEGASLSIPGEEFPNVPGHSLYEADPIQRLQPDPSQSATADSPLQWIAGADNTRVRIDWLAFDESEQFRGFPMSCEVRDDGQFQLEPEWQLELMAAGGDHALKVRYSRIYSRLDVSNGIVFYQQTEIAE